MKVFLTGATGYIGSAVADALQAAGHTVIGLVRSEDGVRRLKERDIDAHIGDLKSAESLIAAVRQADGVIHTASTNNFDAPEADITAIEAILNALEGTNKPLIYTSGTWVMGNTGENIANEESQIDPTPLVAWRPAVEQQVLKAAERGVRTVVVRPALVYGRGGGVLANIVYSARENGFVRFIGTGENYWTLVHVEDLAKLYVQALEKAPAKTLWIAASGSPVKVSEIAQAVSQTVGIPGQTQAWPLEQARQLMGPFADALVLDQKISGTKAMQLLGWKPQSPSVIDELKHGSYVNGVQAAA